MRSSRIWSAELRVLADGRGDLLAEQAGIMAGAWAVQIDTGDTQRSAVALPRTPTHAVAGPR
jgi:hypothetical protein